MVGANRTQRTCDRRPLRGLKRIQNSQILESAKVAIRRAKHCAIFQRQCCQCGIGYQRATNLCLKNLLAEDFPEFLPRPQYGYIRTRQPALGDCTCDRPRERSTSGFGVGCDAYKCEDRLLRKSDRFFSIECRLEPRPACRVMGRTAVVGVQ